MKSRLALALARGHDAKPVQKRDRSAFGYFEPDGEGKHFAQCSTCRIWIAFPGRCYWLGRDFEVTGKDSCIMYVQGDPMEDIVEPVDVFSPKEVGFVREKVRCENCVSSDGKGHCGLFQLLNHATSLFDLDIAIKPHGCCNAFMGKD